MIDYTNRIVSFSGNRLTRGEKKLRMERLDGEDLDPEILSYIKKINSFPFVVTTQSCCGHGENPKAGRHAHFDFRCSLPPEAVIDELLKPMQKKFPGIHFSLYGLQCDRLRYCLWLDNQIWERQIAYFIELLGCLNDLQEA